MSGNNSSRIVRFGIFEVDLKAGELRRNGLRIKLQQQPLQVLAALLEHPGEVVTRDELRNKLWPADTFVDFDHTLNTAIKRLRDALGDDPDNPRFVETPPGKLNCLFAVLDPPDIDPGHANASPQPRATSPPNRVLETISVSLLKSLPRTDFYT